MKRLYTMIEIANPCALREDLPDHYYCLGIPLGTLSDGAYYTMRRYARRLKRLNDAYEAHGLGVQPAPIVWMPYGVATRPGSRTPKMCTLGDIASTILDRQMSGMSMARVISALHWQQNIRCEIVKSLWRHIPEDWHAIVCLGEPDPRHAANDVLFELGGWEAAGGERFAAMLYGTRNMIERRVQKMLDAIACSAGQLDVYVEGVPWLNGLTMLRSFGCMAFVDPREEEHAVVLAAMVRGKSWPGEDWACQEHVAVLEQFDRRALGLLWRAGWSVAIRIDDACRRTKIIAETIREAEEAGELDRDGFLEEVEAMR